MQRGLDVGEHHRGDLTAVGEALDPEGHGTAASTLAAVVGCDEVAAGVRGGKGAAYADARQSHHIHLTGGLQGMNRQQRRFAR